VTRKEQRPLPEQAADRWERLAGEWVPFIRNRLSFYRTEVILPSVMRLAGEVADKRVIDLGCGEGEVTRILTGRGACCEGIDLSPTMIRAAADEARRCGLAIRYHVGDMTDASVLTPESFDLAVSVMSILDAPNGLDAFGAAARLLKPGGELVFITSHPVLERGRWQQDEEGLKSVCLISDYRGSSFIRERISARMDGEVYQFLFCLSEYLNAIANAGLMIVHCEEPSASPEAMERYPSLGRFRKAAPLWAARVRKVDRP